MHTAQLRLSSGATENADTDTAGVADGLLAVDADTDTAVVAVGLLAVDADTDTAGIAVGLLAVAADFLRCAASGGASG